MIRYYPLGSGHPYSVDTEQRWPIDLTLIVAPGSLLVIAGVLATDIGIVWLGLISTRPLLVRAASGVG